MLVNLKKIKQDIKIYNKLINEYENNYLNYYNVISSISFLWKDGNSKKFYDSANKEKRYCIELLSELNLIKDVYKYLYTRYSKFGEVIYVDLKEIDYVITKFDNCIEKAKNIVNMYKNLNYLKNDNLIIIKQREQLEKNIIEMEKNKEQLKKYINEIKNIEQIVKNRLRKIELSIIKETNISRLV